jgi:hypothetical protein
VTLRLGVGLGLGETRVGRPSMTESHVDLEQSGSLGLLRLCGLGVSPAGDVV